VTHITIASGSKKASGILLFSIAEEDAHTTSWHVSPLIDRRFMAREAEIKG